MFYEVKYPQPEPGQKKVSALVVLNPAESRRLVARAAVQTEEVQNAYRNGMIIIARGITNAFFSEELFGIKVEPKANQTVGCVTGGITNANTGRSPCRWHVVRNGKVLEGADPSAEILNFGGDDVFVKGANAVDPEGNVGVLVSNMKAGTIGMAWPIVTARGSHLIMPVGLEKLVPSVIEAAGHSGIYYFKYSTGLPARLAPVVQGKVITEIQAIGILTGARAYHIASGGVGGSEGAVVLSIEGDEARVKKAFDLVTSIKGEPPVSGPESTHLSAAEDYKFDALAQLEVLKEI